MYCHRVQIPIFEPPVSGKNTKLDKKCQKKQFPLVEYDVLKIFGKRTTQKLVPKQRQFLSNPFL